MTPKEMLNAAHIKGALHVLDNLLSAQIRICEQLQQNRDRLQQQLDDLQEAAPEN